MKPNFVAYFHQTIRIWSICYIYAIFIVEWNLETNGNEIDLASVDPLTLAKGGFIVRLGRNLRNLKKENLKMRNPLS